MEEVKINPQDIFNKFFKHGIESRTLYSGQSFFGPVNVRQTKTNEKLELWTGDGHLQSSTCLNGEIKGSVWDYYLVAPAFFPENFKFKSLCLLGLGVGTTVKLFNKTYSPERIVGVEIDPVIISLGQRYFSLNDHNLEIACADASEFIAGVEEKFDLIIVDTFQQDRFSQSCERLEFYSNCLKCLNPGGVIVVNRARTQKQKEANRAFQQQFAYVFPETYVLPVHWNAFYFGLTTPIQKGQALNHMINIGNEYHLEFLKRINANDLRVPRINASIGRSQ